MNSFEEYLDKLQKTIEFKFRPIRWFASNLQKKFPDKVDSYQSALEIVRSWWNEKGAKALKAAKPPEIEVFSELRKDKDGSFYGTIYLVKDQSDPITDKDKKIILDVMKKYGALRDMPFKEQKYKNGKIVYKTVFTFTKDKNRGIFINRFKHNVVDEIRKYSNEYSVSSRIPGWLYDIELKENNNMKTKQIFKEEQYTIDDVADALEEDDLKKAYLILFESGYSEEDAKDLVNSYYDADKFDESTLDEASILPADAIIEYASENNAWEEVTNEFIDQSTIDVIETVCDSLGIPYGSKDAIDIKSNESKEVIKEDDVEDGALPAVPESPDQLVAKIVEIRGKIDAVAKNVANIQAYCANHTDQREINDLTVDLNSGIQDAIEALDDIITAAGDQKKEDKKAAVDAIDQIA